MLNPDELYDNAFQPDNVYGHCLALLERYRDHTAATDGIHLDLGCGFGRVAEPIRNRLGLTYVGVDGSSAGLTSLRERGFEAHSLVFEGFEQTLSGLNAIIAGRKVMSLSMMDTLEHLTNGAEMLTAIRTIIGPNNVPAVISVPNFSHRDVGFKLAFGRWDYTREGLLDHTHVRVFTPDGLRRTFEASGLQLVASKDVRIVKSDQHFPDTHPALASGSLLAEFLTGLRDQVNTSAAVNQLVCLVVAGPKSQGGHYLLDSERKTKHPFLSVVMRTQGRRSYTMIEALTALAGQKDRDFELLVIGHKLTHDEQLGVERQLADSPDWLRRQTRLVLVDDGNRTRPLNRGFEEARGDYIVILDDDDVPMAHWVQTFRKLAEEKPGRVLRTIAAKQDVDIVEVQGQKAVRATGGLEPYPAQFDLLQHMITNETPPIAIAFPRGVFHDLNIRFDETMTTTEDWDYFLRCALIVGVHAAEEITAIYHWWASNVESSRTVHNQAEWDANYLAINRRIDSMPLLLPAGSSRQLRTLRTLHAARAVGDNGIGIEPSNLLRQVLEILSSRSWRWSWINRVPRLLRGRQDPKIVDCLDMSDHQLAALLIRLRKSSSWRRTAIFRPRKRS